MDSFIEILKDSQKLEEFKKTIPEKTSFRQLKESFLKSIEKNTEGISKVAVLFSGGVDSSLIAKAVSQEVNETILYCVGLKESLDIKTAAEAASELELPLVSVIVPKNEISAYLSKTKKLPERFNPFQLEIAVPEFIALEKICEDKIDFVFSGQGSDEIFCGYSKYKQVLEESGYAGVEEEIWRKLENLWSHDLFRERALADYFSLKQKLPYLEEEFVRTAIAVPAREKIISPNDDLRKHPVRKLAKELGTSKKIYERRKKAVQYGSGIGKKVRRILKDQL